MAKPENWYGRIPVEVLTAPISDRAIRIYGILAAHVFEANAAYIGVRRLASLIPGASKSQIHRRLKELEDAGLISVSRQSKGRRSFYSLTSPVFAQKQGRETVTRSAPGGVPRMVSIAREDVA